MTGTFALVHVDLDTEMYRWSCPHQTREIRATTRDEAEMSAVAEVLMNGRPCQCSVDEVVDEWVSMEVAIDAFTHDQENPPLDPDIARMMPLHETMTATMKAARCACGPGCRSVTRAVGHTLTVSLTILHKPGCPMEHAPGRTVHVNLDQRPS